MPRKPKLIKVGRQGITSGDRHVPAAFFRHQQPGKRFVVLAGEDRRLMHVRAADLDEICRAYLTYRKAQAGRTRGGPA